MSSVRDGRRSTPSGAVRGLQQILLRVSLVFDVSGWPARAKPSGELMSKTCSICSHSEREAIDQQLVGGMSLRKLAEQTGTSSTALHRHKTDHLPAALVKGKDAEEVAHGDSLLDQLQSLQSKALGILTKAESTGDFRSALGAIREVRSTLELIAKVTGELRDKGITVVPVVNFTIGKGYDDQPSTSPSGANGVE